VTVDKEKLSTLKLLTDLKVAIIALRPPFDGYIIEYTQRIYPEIAK